MLSELELARSWSDWLYAGRDAEVDAAGELAFYGGPPARGGPGLVSVSTSGQRPRWSGSRPSVPSHVAEETAVAAAVAGVFMPDPHGSRWARLRRCVGVAARAIGVLAPHDRVVMVTLTYRGTNEAWSPRHISDYLKRCRRFLERCGLPFRYVWVAELQRRGVVHYHVATWLPAGVELPMPDESGWWPHGWSRIETARKAVPYLMSYLKKGDGVTRGGLPGGARCHGRGGLGEEWRAVLRWLSLPAFIQARADVHEARGWARAKGGGWWAPGEAAALGSTPWASEWEFVKVGLRGALRRVLDHGRPFATDGPYSRVTV